MLDTQWKAEIKADITKSGKEVEHLEVTRCFQGDYDMILQLEAAASSLWGLISVYLVTVFLLCICLRERTLGIHHKHLDKSVWKYFYLQQPL